MQNRYLRALVAAYQGTSVGELHVGTMMPSIKEHLELIQAKSRSALKISVIRLP